MYGFSLHEFAHYHSDFNTLFSTPKDTGFISNEAALSNGVTDSNAHCCLRRLEEIIRCLRSHGSANPLLLSFLVTGPSIGL